LLEEGLTGRRFRILFREDPRIGKEANKWTAAASSRGDTRE